MCSLVTLQKNFIFQSEEAASHSSGGRFRLWEPSILNDCATYALKRLRSRRWIKFAAVFLVDRDVCGNILAQALPQVALENSGQSEDKDYDRSN